MPNGYKDEIKMTDNGLSTKPTLSMSTKSGTTRATGGINIMISVLIKKTLLNRIRDADKTKPAKEAVAVAIITIAMLKSTELMTHFSITPLSKNLRLFQALR